MKNERLEELRNTICSMITSHSVDKAELLDLSQKLDDLIVLEMQKSYSRKPRYGGEFTKQLSSLLEKIQIFDKMYHSMRIVDPVAKKVLEVREKEVHQLDLVCHDFWQKGEMCDNCISMRAYNENDTVFKLEQNNDSIYIVTAVPVSIEGRTLVVEFLKNVTNHFYISAETSGAQPRKLATIEYMNKAAVMDGLTDLFNRRYINERLPVDLLNCYLRNAPLSVIFADLDHFKVINDSFGHPVGDQVLMQVAEEFKKHVRSSNDWIARYGGEEFFICLKDTDHTEAMSIAERIRTGIMEREFSADGHTINLTCSFGVHTVKGGSICPTSDELIDKADKNLYKAKLEGRNKVV